jgi:undecaprenyl-diphosphatase
MAEWLEVVILGIIEGITEFLPISSTGHLLLAQQYMKHPQSDMFLVFIQSGAVLAVILIFKERLIQLLKNWREPESIDYILKLGGAFMITAVGGLILKALNFELPDEALPIGVALLVGGLLFLIVERGLKGKSLSDSITWKIAIVIGISQLLAAIFPGTSRSGSTILFALILGLNRKIAIEFSFLLGVPTLLAASGLKLVSEIKDSGVAHVDWGMLSLGTLVSGIVGFVAVKWLLKYVQSHTFEGFGWYRIVLGILVLALM